MQKLAVIEGPKLDFYRKAVKLGGWVSINSDKSYLVLGTYLTNPISVIFLITT